MNEMPLKTAKKKIAERRTRNEKQPMDPVIRNIMVFMVLLIIADLALILYFQKQPVLAPPVPEKQTITDIAAQEYVNPEAGNLKSLKTGGEFDRKMPVFAEKLKFNLIYDPILAGPNGLHALSVCCPGGYKKEYYTAKMPWAFLLYEYEPGIPTVTIFDIDKAAGKGKFVIVVLDKDADESEIKAVSVTIFEELLKQYLPGVEWEGSMRKEIM